MSYTIINTVTFLKVWIYPNVYLIIYFACDEIYVHVKPFIPIKCLNKIL